MSDLEGTRALVTGASSGLGRAMAAALVGAGARVVVTSRDRERSEAVAAELGPGAIGLALDVREQTSVEGVVDETYARLGGRDPPLDKARGGVGAGHPPFLR